MAGAMGYFDYASDDTTTYKVKLDSSNTTSVGGAPATSVRWYPRGWVPRYLLAQHAVYGRRKVFCPDPTDDHWTGVTNTIALQVVGVAVSPTFDITGRFGEKRTSRG
jgi:hypothetical protein